MSEDRTIPERPEPDCVPKKPVYDYAQTVTEDEDDERRLGHRTW